MSEAQSLVVDFTQEDNVLMFYPARRCDRVKTWGGMVFMSNNNGQWRSASDGKTCPTISPITDAKPKCSLMTVANPGTATMSDQYVSDRE
ncbi:hypothetical protein [Gloeocapsopsis sp. IPPAS B-1203]|uniref:hypothetical protein n=1 Tax=Gloeocapsopsis sp. IPPAS B-1203 TaxID=2049454 RepID=UPI000C18DB13|nr:hypothetical protein [Gloeocapsopsis sp. IPPAS B-1203]PIG92955.1 hypothetical protein CSQ79_12055 [Gloeocapsopsis sp. IPPAS B-1203]